MKKNYNEALNNALICAKLRPMELLPYKNIFAAGINAYYDSSFDVANHAFTFLTNNSYFIMNQFSDSTYFTLQLALAFRYLNKIDSCYYNT